MVSQKHPNVIKSLSRVRHAPMSLAHRGTENQQKIKGYPKETLNTDGTQPIGNTTIFCRMCIGLFVSLRVRIALFVFLGICDTCLVDLLGRARSKILFRIDLAKNLGFFCC